MSKPDRRRFNDEPILSIWLVVSVLVALLSGCSSPTIQIDSGIEQKPELTFGYVLADDGYKLPISRYWTEHKPETIVIALHGFNDYSNAFEAMCTYFVSLEIACLAYDQRGFGQTAMRGVWPQAGRLQQDLRMIVKLVREDYPEAQIFIAGESMGGAVILTAIANGDGLWQSNISGAILFAPAVWARHTQPWYQRWSLWLAVHTFPSWKPTGEGLGVVASDNTEALRAMGRDENIIKATRIDTIFGLTNLMDEALQASDKMAIKTLVLYGENDQVIPKKPTCEMLMGMQGAGLNIDFAHYPKGYHMLTRDLQAERVFRDSALWMYGNFRQGLSSDHLQLVCEK